MRRTIGFSLAICGLVFTWLQTDSPPLAAAAAPTTATAAQPAPVAGPFPRRMLFIHISKYMFLNPLTAGQFGGEDRTKGAAIHWANEWNIPFDPKDEKRNQLFILSDSARRARVEQIGMLPMKQVVVGAYERFFETSRAQDRIVFYFGGHALEKDGRAYIAPVEGDLDTPDETLILLSDFYQKLRGCRATQKLVIWDVCRFNPQRGRQRPGSEPMTESLHKALTAAPPGVEVIVTCKPGENALEFFNLQIDPGPAASTRKYAGSVFLESVTGPRPNDPLPDGDWLATVGKRVSEMAESPVVNLKQTVGKHGKLKEPQTPFDATEAPAKSFEFVMPKRDAAADVTNIVLEFRVPPIKLDLIESDLVSLPFREVVLKSYKDGPAAADVLKDKATLKFEAKTLEALEKVRSLWTVNPAAAGPQLRDEFKAPVSDRLKADIKKEQDYWSLGIAELELINADLDSLAEMREVKSKRWQANYDFARATVKVRIAFMNEYVKLLGDIRTESLPALDQKLGQDSYKLTSSEKMRSKKDIQALAAEAKELYDKIIAEHKGTPWAIEAKRDKAFALGLEWKPISSRNGTP